jgi:hypothetical protein
VRFAPAGAYGQVRGQEVFTHGVELGVMRNEQSLRDATEGLIRALTQSNPALRRGESATGRMAGYDALITVLSNTSEATGRREVVVLKTILLRDGTLFYAIDVAPEEDYKAYRQTFDRITRSIQFRS